MTPQRRTLQPYCSVAVCKYCVLNIERWGGHHHVTGLLCRVLEEKVKYGDRCSLIRVERVYPNELPRG